MHAEKKAKVLNADGFLVPDQRSPLEIKWEKYTTGPMIVLSFAFIIGYTMLILGDDRFVEGNGFTLLGIMIAIWILFIIDYFARLTLASNKKRFVKKNIIDLVSLVLPFARPFLLLVYLSRLKWFRGHAGANVRGRLIVYAVAFAVLYIYVISLAVLSVERNAPGATIVNFGDSLWWAMVTIATVGYGDVVPITVMGRIYATFLMLGGMVIVGAATGTVVSYLNEQVQNAHKKALESHNSDTPSK